MTDKTHPITPPLELFKQWEDEADNQRGPFYHYIATQAARWGADAQLEACCDWLDNTCCDNWDETAAELRAAMRPKPPSLAEEALEQLNGIETVVKATYGGDLVDDTIRRALERLQELENND